MSDTTTALPLYPLEVLAGHPDNIRRDLGDLTDLAASIDANGLIEPLIVLPANEQGVHLVVAGNRRLAAAALAGVEGVPCLIRDLTGEQVLEVMLVENLQRSDLTPIEEGRAYARLAGEYARSAVDIARKVGRSDDTVRARLNLVALPPAVLDLVECGDLRLNDAAAIAKWADDDDLMGYVVNLPANQLRDVEAKVKTRVAEIAMKEAMLEARRALHRQELTELVAPNSWWNPSSSFDPNRAIKVEALGDITWDHTVEQCHAVFLVARPDCGGQVVVDMIPVCTDPDRHTTIYTGSDVVRSENQIDPAIYDRWLPSDTDDGEAAVDEYEATRAARRVAHEARHTFMGDLVRTGTLPEIPPLVAADLIQIAVDSGAPEPDELCTLALGPGQLGPDEETPAYQDLAEAGVDPEFTQRWAWSVVLLDLDCRENWPQDRHLWCTHVEFLISHGYQAHDIELVTLAENAEARTAQHLTLPVAGPIDLDALVIYEDTLDALREIPTGATEVLLPAGSGVTADLEARGWITTAPAPGEATGTHLAVFTPAGRQVLAAIQTITPDPDDDPEQLPDAATHQGPHIGEATGVPRVEVGELTDIKDPDRLDQCIDPTCTATIPGEGGAHSRAKAAGWGRRRRPDGTNGFVCPGCRVPA